MKVCGQEWRLKIKKNLGGGCFWSHGEDGSGRGEIHIGEADSDLRYLAKILMHEVVEAILDTDGKRSKPTTSSADDYTHFLFQFDHHYLNDRFPDSLLDALLTSGLFKLIDPRPKKGKK